VGIGPLDDGVAQGQQGLFALLAFFVPGAGDERRHHQGGKDAEEDEDDGGFHQGEPTLRHNYSGKKNWALLRVTRWRAPPVPSVQPRRTLSMRAFQVAFMVVEWRKYSLAA